VSGALITVKVTPEDGGDPFVVAATARDVLVWEKSSRDNSYARLMSNQRMTDIYRIAHIAAKRLGLYSDDLATFEKTCDVENVPEDEAESDPTSPGP
jgi:hypothetical protein